MGFLLQTERMLLRTIGDSKIDQSVDVRVSGCLFVSLVFVKGWQPVQEAPHLVCDSFICIYIAPNHK